MINKKLIRPSIMSDAFSKNMTNVTEVTHYGRNMDGEKIVSGKFSRKKEIIDADDIIEENKLRR